MDGGRFDALAKALAGGAGSRRGALRLLGGLTGGALLAGRAAPAGADCCGPDRALGQSCQCDCQCDRGVRCGNPRPGPERAPCGQDPTAAEVCCLGKGEACSPGRGGRDCGCCGGLSCQGGQCRSACNAVSCPRGCCAASGACRSGSSTEACGDGGNPCQDCATDQTCLNGICIDDLKVFVTSTTHTGALGGLSGADSHCRALAAAANLPGTYKAWLSDGTASPATRFVRSPGPYRLVTGTKIANNWNDLTNGALDRPIDLTETGALVTTHRGAWTDTKANGEAYQEDWHCDNWTSAGGAPTGLFGQVNSKKSSWTFVGGAECGTLKRLYCFQQG